ncbi:MAG: hypothetical protein WBP16_15355 [Ferruginibacter sp.]
MKTSNYFRVMSLVILVVSGCNYSSSNKEAGTTIPVAPSEKTSMEMVIKMDDSLGKIRNHACETATLSQAITNYADEIGKLDFTQCPKVFKTAFAKHRQAWIDFRELSDKYPDLRAEMHDLFDELEKSTDSLLFKKLSKQIWDTWGDIEKAMKNN